MTATTRTPLKHLVLAAAGAWIALAGGVAQAAPDDLQRVEISGRRPGEIPRTDVRATCPGVDASIVTRMSPLQFRARAEGLSTISFRLNGETVSDVRQTGSPLEYRQLLRRAVSDLKCSGPARDTLFVMQVQFRNEGDDGDGANRVAMIEFAPPAAGAPAAIASAAAR